MQREDSQLLAAGVGSGERRRLSIYDQLVSNVFQQTLAGKSRRTTDKCEEEAGCGKDGVSGKNVKNYGKRTIPAWDVGTFLL